MADTPLLRVEDLTVRYGQKGGNITAVSDVSFEVEREDYFGLVGESGCGKSTVSRAVLGALDANGRITSGEIYFKGEPIHEMTETELNEKIRWKEIAWIPQGSLDSLDPLEKISDQALELAHIHTDLSDDAALDKFAEMFDVVGIAPERIHDYPHEFSGGMKQRAVIALALFLEPSLIIADEPTTALDVIMQDQIFDYLQQIREDNDTSMLIITHDIAVIFEACNKMAVMHSGQVAESGRVEDIYDNPRHPYTILLQEAIPDYRSPDRELDVIGGSPPQMVGEVDYCTFVDRCPWAVDECRDHAPRLEPAETAGDPENHDVACFRSDEAYELYERETAKAGKEETGVSGPAAESGASDTGGPEPLLDVRNLEKFFESGRRSLLDVIRGEDPDYVQAVDGVDLSLDENDSVGIIGESGCGKTTLLMTLAGLYEPTGGEISFRGTSFSEFDRGDWREFRRNVQMIFQDPFNSLDPKFTVEQTLKEVLSIHNYDDKDERVRGILERVELNPPEQYLDKYPGELSGGEKQRVSIARALIIEPSVILADEPVSMLDVSTQASLLNLLSDLVDEMDVLLIYISHDLSTVSHVCEELNVMYLGRIIENGRTQEVIDDPKHPYTQALINAIPLPDPHHPRERQILEGSPSDPINMGEGCRFRFRCPERMDVCEVTPRFADVDGDDRNVACHLYYDHEIAGEIYE